MYSPWLISFNYHRPKYALSISYRVFISYFLLLYLSLALSNTFLQLQKNVLPNFTYINPFLFTYVFIIIIIMLYEYGFLFRQWNWVIVC